MWNSPTIADRMGRAAAITAAALFTTAAAANQLNGIRLHDAPESTRVVLDTSAVPRYKLFLLERPNRVVIDLDDTKVAATFKAPEIDSRVVKRIRSARRRRANYRVVLDLAIPAKPKYFVLEPVRPYGHRLVIDLYPGVRDAPPPPTVIQAPAGERDVVVAIDAGHGGEDTGAIGVGGIYEKTVTLAIAKAVQRDLDAMAGLRGVLVRSGDYYVPLRQRPDRARLGTVPADLFISVHADAFPPRRSVRGAAVYVLSRGRAMSEMAKWLAADENRSDLIGGVGDPIAMKDKEDTVAKVVADLSVRHKMNASNQLGEAVLRSLGEVVKLHKRQVDRAGFVVLKSLDLPSILIETGFLSNPDEAKLLATSRHQRRIAGAIARGVQRYLLAHPPPGTLLASLKDDGVLRYVIKSGDTLSQIAQRNRVPMARLKALNRIASDHIEVGQVLLIPFVERTGS